MPARFNVRAADPAAVSVLQQELGLPRFIATTLAARGVTTPQAAREFSAYAYPVGAGGAFLAEFPDRDNHTIDAVRYAMEEVALGRGAHTIARQRDAPRGRSWNR